MHISNQHKSNTSATKFNEFGHLISLVNTLAKDGMNDKVNMKHQTQLYKKSSNLMQYDKVRFIAGSKRNPWLYSFDNMT